MSNRCARKIGRKGHLSSRRAAAPVTGMITRYNKKTISIVTDDGQRWNVAPQFLQRVSLHPGDLSDSSVVSIQGKR